MSDLPEGYSIALGDLEDIAALISIDKAASALFGPTGLLEPSALEDHVPAEVFEQEIPRANVFVATADIAAVRRAVSIVISLKSTG